MLESNDIYYDYVMVFLSVPVNPLFWVILYNTSCR